MPGLILKPMEYELFSTLSGPYRLLASKGFSAPFRVQVTHAGTKGLIVLDQLRTVDKVRLAKRLGAVSAKTLTAVLATLQEVFAE